jgi:putative flippase GtrA
VKQSLHSLYSLVIQEAVKRKQFILYSLIGVSGATLDFIAFMLMIKFLPIHYLIANTLSTTLGIMNNFMLNARFNFGVKDRLFSRFLSFFAVGLLGMAVGSAMLWLLVDIMAVAPVISKFLIIVVIVLLQYNLNKRVSFARSKRIQES